MFTPFTSIEDLGSGILIYKNVIPKDLDIINRLESALNKGNEMYKWEPALVGYQESMPEHRDCFDFKFKKSDIQHDQSVVSLELQQIWQDCYDRKKLAVDDYCNKFNIHNLRYWEAFNFIKYNKGQHFQKHSDHGYSYNCTVSLVTYLNDDFEGGELYFDRQKITYKPEAGDLAIFPSTYIYTHRAMPVISGTKYSIATMLDYSAKYHTPDMYMETGD